jgi:peptide/nickel transport system permease protein
MGVPIWLGQRVLMLLAVIITAGTLNFALPKLAPQNPVEAKLLALTESGGSLNDISGLVASYNQKFGLDKPVVVQYANYLKSMATFDLGYSIAFYPARVADLIVKALPWTIGLLCSATLIAFAIGTLLGALAAWRGAPGVVAALGPAVMVLAALPYYLVGLVLVYLFAFTWAIFPLQGGASLMAVSGWNWGFALDVLGHSLLPAGSIVLASVGTWALAMRGMMVTVQGEDYMLYAEANGIPPRRRFLGYGLRNAMLPQLTSLALHLGQIAAGSVLVERVFGYPGLGMLLFQAIQQSDYFVIYGCVLIIVMMVACATLLVDLAYPLLDPRVRLGGAR